MENLKVKSTYTETQTLSFNEWSDKLGVSSRYIEPTKYFQGNPSSGFIPLDEREGYSFIGYIGRKFKELINQ
jgi:hypothetical protein